MGDVRDSAESKTTLSAIFDIGWDKKECRPAVEVCAADGSLLVEVSYRDLKDGAVRLADLLAAQMRLGPENVVGIVNFGDRPVDHGSLPSTDVIVIQLQLAVMMCGSAFMLVTRESASHMLRSGGVMLVVAFEDVLEEMSAMLAETNCQHLGILELLKAMENPVNQIRDVHQTGLRNHNACWLSWSRWEDDDSDEESEESCCDKRDSELSCTADGKVLWGGLTVVEHRNAVEYFSYRWNIKALRQRSRTAPIRVVVGPLTQDTEGLRTADVMALLADGHTLQLFAASHAEASPSSSISWAAMWQPPLVATQRGADVVCCSPSLAESLAQQAAAAGEPAASSQAPILSVYLNHDLPPTTLASASSTLAVQLVTGRVASGPEFSWLQSASTGQAETQASQTPKACSAGGEWHHGTLAVGGKASVMIDIPPPQGSDDGQCADGGEDADGVNTAGSARGSGCDPALKGSIGKDGRGFVEVEVRQWRAEHEAGKELQVRFKGTEGDGFAVRAALVLARSPPQTILPGHVAHGVAARVCERGAAAGSLRMAHVDGSEGAATNGAEVDTATVFSMPIRADVRALVLLRIAVGDGAQQLQATDPSAVMDAFSWDSLARSFNVPWVQVQNGATARGARDRSDASDAKLEACAAEEQRVGRRMARAVVYASGRTTKPSPAAFDWMATGEWCAAGASSLGVLLHTPAWEQLQARSDAQLSFSVCWECFDTEDRSDAGGGDSWADTQAVQVVVEQRAEEEAFPLELRGGIQLLQSLFEDVDAFKLAEERGGGTIQDSAALTYGEIEFVPFVALLQRLSLTQGGSFCDLGCGSGRAVRPPPALAHMSVSGVELLPELAQAGVEMCRRFEDAVQRGPSEETATDATTRFVPPVQIVEGDILQDTSWHECSVVYVASLCFDMKLLNGLSAALRGLNSGAIVLSLERLSGLARRWLVLTGCESMVMTWGVCEVFVYRRC